MDWRLLLPRGGSCHNSGAHHSNHMGHLVRELGVSLATIHRAEAVDRKTVMTLANASAVRRAFENAGVELIEENGGGPGETSRWLK